MRVLTAIGLCDEIGSQTYAANERTHSKIQEGSIGAEKHQYDYHRCFFLSKVAAKSFNRWTDRVAVSTSIFPWYPFLH